jgi:hypothetical protein
MDGGGGDAAPEAGAVEPGVHDLQLQLRRRPLRLRNLRRLRGGGRRDHRLAAAPGRRRRLPAPVAAAPHPPHDARGELDGDEQQDVEQRQRAAAAHRRAVRRRLPRPLRAPRLGVVLPLAAVAHAALFLTPAAWRLPRTEPRIHALSSD